MWENSYRRRLQTGDSPSKAVNKVPLGKARTCNHKKKSTREENTSSSPSTGQINTHTDTQRAAASHDNSPTQASGERLRAAPHTPLRLASNIYVSRQDGNLSNPDCGLLSITAALLSSLQPLQARTRWRERARARYTGGCWASTRTKRGNEGGCGEDGR